jgi:hypothetical protein
LITVGPEARPGALALGGLDFEEAAELVLLSVLAADWVLLSVLGLAWVDWIWVLGWAKPAMAKLNPNVSAIAVFFIILTFNN